MTSSVERTDLDLKISVALVGGVILHGNVFNKTIIYERILGKIASIYIT